MTAVVLARHGNVVDVDFGPAVPPPAAGPDEPWWPWAGEVDVETAPGKTPAATRLPVRWSPRPVRVLRRRIGRSPLAADLRDYASLIGLLAAAVAGFVLRDHLHTLTHILTGGTP